MAVFAALPGVASAAPPTLAAALDLPPELKLSGSTRLRYEAIDGQPRAGFNPNDSLVNLRTTLFAEYDTGPVRLGVEVYDSRVWNGNAGTPVTTGEVNTFEPVQAYAALDLAAPFGAGTSATVQAGRFLLNLGSRRLVAADDYRNTTNGFTGLRADLSPGGGVKATLIYVLPQLRLPDDRASLLANRSALDRESFDTVLWGGLIAKGRAIGATTAELSFYHLGERDGIGRPTRDRYIDSIDVRLIREPASGKWDHELEGIYQLGRISSTAAINATTLDIAAWFFHAKIGYTASHGWKPHVSLEFDAASGDRGQPGRYSRFDPLFGMRRADFAPAGLYNAVGRANLVTPGVRVEVTPDKRTDGFLSYHALWLASPTDAFSTTGVRDPSGNAGSFAGHQIEGRVRYWLIPQVLRAEANGVLLAKGRFLRVAPNAPANGDTHYLSLNLTALF
jgi:hypothetical protein